VNSHRKTDVQIRFIHDLITECRFASKLT
jgi:hypothetical protein